MTTRLTIENFLLGTSHYHILLLIIENVEQKETELQQLKTELQQLNAQTQALQQDLTAAHTLRAKLQLELQQKDEALQHQDAEQEQKEAELQQKGPLTTGGQGKP